MSVTVFPGVACSVSSAVPSGELRNEPNLEGRVPGPLDFGPPPRMRSEVVGIPSALSCLLKSRLVTPSKREVAVWSLVLSTPSGRVDGSLVSLESSGGLGIGCWVSATPSSRVVGGVKVSVRGTPSSVGKGSWVGGGWVKKISVQLESEAEPRSVERSHNSASRWPHSQ